MAWLRRHSVAVKLELAVDAYQPWCMSDREREVATKYLSFLQARRGLKRDPSLLSLTPADQPLSPSGEPPSGHAHHHALPSPCHDGQSFPPHASAYCADPAPAVSDGKPLSLSATAFCRGSLFIVWFFGRQSDHCRRPGRRRRASTSPTWRRCASVRWCRGAGCSASWRRAPSAGSAAGSSCAGPTSFSTRYWTSSTPNRSSFDFAKVKSLI